MAVIVGCDSVLMRSTRASTREQGSGAICATSDVSSKTGYHEFVNGATGFELTNRFQDKKLQKTTVQTSEIPATV